MSFYESLNSEPTSSEKMSSNNATPPKSPKEHHHWVTKCSNVGDYGDIQTTTIGYILAFLLHLFFPYSKKWGFCYLQYISLSIGKTQKIKVYMLASRNCGFNFIWKKGFFIKICLLWCTPILALMGQRQEYLCKLKVNRVFTVNLWQPELHSEIPSFKKWRKEGREINISKSLPWMIYANHKSNDNWP